MRDDPRWIFSLLLRCDAVRLPISTDCAIVQITNRKEGEEAKKRAIAARCGHYSNFSDRNEKQNNNDERY